MKNAVLIYGISGGVLIAALRFAEYRFLVVEHSIEIYAALIAAVFAGVGVWLGPLTNAAYTFIEPFPVGLLVTVISAAALRRKPRMA